MKRRLRLHTHQWAAAILLIALPFISNGSFHRHVFIVLASEADENPSLCTADDPRQECTNPEASFDFDDFEDDSDDYDDEFELACVDDEEECKYWSRIGECDSNPNYMLKHCKLSCKACDNEIITYGLNQLIRQAYRPDEVRDVITKTISYMKRISADKKYKDVINECKNKDTQCSEWALDDGCDDNPRYMKAECAPACQSCDYVSEMKEMCGISPDSSLDAIKPGGMNELFQNMVHSADKLGFEPKVWSRPLKTYGSAASNESDKIAPTCENDLTNPCGVEDGPWVITLENFVSDEEISVLLTWGKAMKYERSQAGDEITPVRTSAHSWCTDECYKDKTVEQIRERIEMVTGIPYSNYECLQLLKYEVGQFYLEHDDHIEYHTKQSHGPRLLTFFIYFNEVEKGGATRFPKLDLTVQAKKGRVLIWPSITDDGTWKTEFRTSHEAMAVEQGQKFAANAWIHMRDFQTPFAKGCPG